MDIKKYHFFILFGAVLLLIGTIIVQGYGTSNPSSFGHSGNEIHVDYTGSVQTLNSALAELSNQFDKVDSEMTITTSETDVLQIPLEADQTWYVRAFLRFTTGGKKSRIGIRLPTNSINGRIRYAIYGADGSFIKSSSTGTTKTPTYYMTSITLDAGPSIGFVEMDGWVTTGSDPGLFKLIFSTYNPGEEITLYEEGFLVGMKTV